MVLAFIVCIGNAVLRPWDIRFAVQRNASAPIHSQIANHIITSIQLGHLTAGMALPGSRELAATLNINRKTAMHAYDELIATGWLECTNKRGTFVAKPKSALPTKVNHASNETTYTPLTQRDTSLEIKASRIDFSAQKPLSFALPNEVLMKATRQALTLANKHYPTSLVGVFDLRNAIAQWLYMEKSMSVQADQVGVVGSKAMALWLCAKQLVIDGGYVVLGEQNSEFAHETLQAAGVPTLKVKCHSQGIDLEDLEKLCINYHVRAVYLPLSSMQNLVNIESSRQAIMSLAQRANFMVIEEDCALELQPSLENQPPSLGLYHDNKTQHERIIYINAFSDWVLPHVSLAYVVASTSFIAGLTQTYQNMCHQSTLINELTILTLIQTGALKRHMKRLMRLYQQKKKWFTQRVATTLAHRANATNAHTHLGNPQTYEFAISEFGIKVELSFPPTRFSSPSYISNAALIEAFMLEANHQQLTLTAPVPNPQQANTYSLTLHFLHLTEQEITAGILRLQSLMDRLAVTLVKT